VPRRLKGFVMEERAIPRQHYDVTDAEGEVIGEVTSGTMSPMLKKRYWNGIYYKTILERRFCNLH